MSFWLALDPLTRRSTTTRAASCVICTSQRWCSPLIGTTSRRHMPHLSRRRLTPCNPSCRRSTPHRRRPRSLCQSTLKPSHLEHPKSNVHSVSMPYPDRGENCAPRSQLKSELTTDEIAL